MGASRLATGLHPPWPGGPGQSRANARQMPSKRPSNAAFSRCRRSARRSRCRTTLAERDPARLLVFCDEDTAVANPVDGACAGAGGPCAPLAVWSGRKAALPRTSAQRCCNSRTWCGCRSGRASCAPTRRRSRPLPWCRRCSATGGERRLATWWIPARPVVANEADVVAVGAMNAGHLAEPAVAGTKTFGDLIVGAGDGGTIGKMPPVLLPVISVPGPAKSAPNAIALVLATLVLTWRQRCRAKRNQELPTNRRMHRRASRPIHSKLNSPCGGKKAEVWQRAAAGFEEIHTIE